MRPDRERMMWRLFVSLLGPVIGLLVLVSALFYLATGVMPSLQLLIEALQLPLQVLSRV